MGSDQTVFRSVVTCIIRKRDKVLVGLQKNSSKKLIDMSNEWIFPTRSVKLNETPEMAAIREAKEETGFLIKILRPLGCKIIKTRRDNKIFFTFSIWFECSPLSRFIKLSPELSKIKWVEMNKLKPLFSKRFKRFMPNEVKKYLFST